MYINRSQTATTSATPQMFKGTLIGLLCQLHSELLRSVNADAFLDMLRGKNAETGK